MTDHTITAEIGTTGQTETYTLTGDAGRDLAYAVSVEHPCTDHASCDIATARAEGFPFSAAYLLQGATETPFLDAVVAALGVDLHHVPAEDWEEWVAYHHTYGVQCDGCGSYTYGDDGWTPDRCANCGRDL